MEILYIIFGAVVGVAVDRAWRWWAAQSRGTTAERQIRDQLARYRKLDPKTKSKSLLSDPSYHTRTSESLEKYFNNEAEQLFTQVTQNNDPTVIDVIDCLTMILDNWDKYRKID